MTLSADIDTLRIGGAKDWQAAGLSRRALARKVSTGELVRIGYGTYAEASFVAAAEADPALAHALRVASALAKHPGAVASHRSAATLHGLGLLDAPPDDSVHITLPAGTRLGPYRRGDVVRHSAALPKAHVTKLSGISATTAARAVVDIARAAPFMAGVATADSALHQRCATKTELRRVLASCTRWPGNGTASAVIEFATGLSESVLESCARVVFHERGLPPPELQVAVYGTGGRTVARVDFLWRQFGVVAEADGLLKYQSGADAIAELKRDRLLRDAGLEVVHLTWSELFREPELVVGRIRQAFERGRRLRRPAT